LLEKIKNYIKDKTNSKNIIIAVLLISILGFYLIYQHNTKLIKEEQSITAFLNFIGTEAAEDIEDVKVYDQNNKITYILDDVIYNVDYPKSYISENPEIINQLSEMNVDIAFEKGMERKVLIVSEFLRIGIFVIIFYFVFNMFGESLLSSSVTEVKAEKTTFKDIAGYEYVKDELREIVDYLNDPTDFMKYTDRMPKGVLLEGPPGNGKTLFARAVAGESDTPFFQISAADIESQYVGSGAKKIKSIFKTVRKKAEESGKVILFIDEIDAVGMKREARTVQETNQTINKLLTEMDGFEKDTKVVVIAATNLSIMLDSALTRSGRFDRIIAIERPSLKEREAVISLYLNKKGDLLDSEVLEMNYAHVLAQQTEGFSNADLDKLVNEASLIAKKKASDTLNIKSLREAFTKIVAGVQTNRVVSEVDKKIVSYHEAGHAVAQIMTSSMGYKGVAYVTITPHGQSLGHVSPVNEERLARKSDIQNKIIVTLAGRAVEEKILGGDYTIGAASDLQQANKLLLGYVAKYGMSNSNENLYIEDLDENKGLIQEETKLVREKLYREAKMMIERHYDIVEKIAQHLLKDSSLEQHELPQLLAGTTYEKVFDLDL
jgi:cell division protease FtsH